MKPAEKVYHLDLSRMESEPLVVLAKECCYQPAWEELLARQEVWKRRLVTRRASAAYLSVADTEDAQQQEELAMQEAIATYDAEQFACSVRTHSGRVLTARFNDFLKKRRRHERGLDRSTTAEIAAETGHTRAAPRGHDPSQDDPAYQAQCSEAMERLKAALGAFPPDQGLLWDRLSAGAKLGQIANELAISYDKVKRLRRKLLSCLTKQLRGL